MNFISQVHAFDKDNLQIYFQNIVAFRQPLLKAIAIWSEQLAHQYCNIASQYRNVARKRTSGLTVNHRVNYLHKLAFPHFKKKTFVEPVCNCIVGRNLETKKKMSFPNSTLRYHCRRLLHQASFELPQNREL